MSTDVLIAENKELREQNASLRHRLKQLERLIFAAKSERFVTASTPEQMEVFEKGAAAVAQEEIKEQITYERKKKKKHPGLTTLPKHCSIPQKSNNWSRSSQKGRQG